ncbi:unnamed protein product [Leuciscus chuanchicus]
MPDGELVDSQASGFSLSQGDAGMLMEGSEVQSDSDSDTSDIADHLAMVWVISVMATLADGFFISAVMENRSCASGFRWDSLLRHCISLESLGLMPAVPPPVLSTRSPGPGQHQSWLAISPGVWICVGLLAGGSVLVLLLWFIIYKRHTRTSQNTGTKVPFTTTTITDFCS